MIIVAPSRLEQALTNSEDPSPQSANTGQTVAIGSKVTGN
jgi:hypothetical protein